MRVLKIALKIIMVLIVISACIYLPFYSDGTQEFYLQFSLLTNFFILLLFSVDSRMNPRLDLSYYSTFSQGNFQLAIMRIKDLSKDIFWIILWMAPLSVFFDSQLSFLFRFWLVALLFLQSFITLYFSIVIFDVLKKLDSEKHFFLIPLLLIAMLNFLIGSDTNPQFLAANPFGGLVFVPYYLFQNFSAIFALIVFCEVIGFILISRQQQRMKL